MARVAPATKIGALSRGPLVILIGERKLELQANGQGNNNYLLTAFPGRQERWRGREGSDTGWKVLYPAKEGAIQDMVT